MNKAIIIGRLGQDPSANKTQSGTTVVNFSVATNESYIDKGGNKVERTEWHRVVTFGRQADFCAEYLSKGRLVLVEGKIQTRKWQDQNGNDRYTSEILAARVQALDPKTQSSHQDYQAENPESQIKAHPENNFQDTMDEVFGDVPI